MSTDEDNKYSPWTMIDVPDTFRENQRAAGFQAALEAPSIHLALKNLRLLLGLSRLEFTEALLPHLPAGKKPSIASICYWETEPYGSSQSSLPSRKIFAGTDPITAYGEVFRARGMGEWFDANAENFRQSLLEAMTTERKTNKMSSSRWNMSHIERDRPAFWDNYVAKRNEVAEAEANVKR